MTDARLAGETLPPGGTPAIPQASARGPVAVAIGVLVFVYRYVTFGGFANDHYVHLSRAQQWLLGDWPVRDFVDPGMPLMDGLSALAQLAFGRGLYAELLLVCTAFGAAAALTYLAAARLTGSSVAGVIAAVIPVVAYPVSYGYPKLLPFSAALALAPLGGAAAALRRVGVLGVITGAAFLLRHDLGVILAAAVTIAMLVEHGRDARRPLLRFTIAGLAIVAPYLLWVQVSEGLATYFTDGVAFSAGEARKGTLQPPRFVFGGGGPSAPIDTGGPCGPRIHVKWAAQVTLDSLPDLEQRHHIVRRDPLGPQTWEYELCDAGPVAVRSLVTDPLVADTDGIDRARFRLAGRREGLIQQWLRPLSSLDDAVHLTDNSVALLFYAVWLLPVVAGAFAAARRRPPWLTVPLVMAIVMQVLMNATMARDPLNNRIRDVLVPAGVLLLCIATWLWRSDAATGVRATRRAVAALAVVLVAVAAGVVGDVAACLRNANVDKGFDAAWEHAVAIRREFAPPLARTGRVPPDYQILVTYLSACSSPRSRVLTLGFYPDLVFHVGRGFAGGQATIIPNFYTTEREQRLMVERLLREDVPFVVADNELWGAMYFNFPVVMAHVDARYREATRFTAGRNLRVLVERSRAIPRTFGPTALPCFSAERGA